MLVTFSFDTELAWGSLEAQKGQALSRDPSNGRDPIRFLLEQFDRYELPATWGVVGRLLVQEWPNRSEPIPDQLQGANPSDASQVNRLYHMPELLDWIKEADAEHEVAGHSFSHPQFSDLSRDQARAELAAMCDVFEDRGCELDSVIHPYIDVSHLDLLFEFGISTYSLGVETKARTLRAGIRPFMTRNCRFWSTPTVEPFVDNEGLVAVPRSRQLSDERWGWLNVRRLQNTLDNCDEGLVHLTLHPHNLLYDPFLKYTVPRMLKIVAQRRDRGDLEVVTFRELASQLR